MENGKGNGTKSWQFIVSAIIAIGAVGSILWGTITFFNSIATLNTQVEEYHLRLDTFFNKLNQLSDQEIKDRSDSVRFEQSLTEIETQFCASDIIRNLVIGEEARKEAVIWQKIFNTPYPTDNTYYPTICQRNESK